MVNSRMVHLMAGLVPQLSSYFPVYIYLSLFIDVLI